jgi:transposase
MNAVPEISLVSPSEHIRDGRPWGRQSHPLWLTVESRELLERWIRAETTPPRIATRARIVLLAADGCSSRAIARTLGVTVRTVSLWRRRCEAEGPTGLLRDAPGRGRTPSITIGPNVTRVLALIESPPAPGERWTIRRVAEATGISRASIHRILTAYERTLHQQERRRA